MMKTCTYCAGNAESGSGAVEVLPAQFTHYSKIECAEVLKAKVEALNLQNEELKAMIKGAHATLASKSGLEPCKCRICLKKQDSEERKCVCGTDESIASGHPELPRLDIVCPKHDRRS